MKKCFLSLIFFLLCSKVLAYTEYPVDFTISTSESDMSFVITSTTNNKVSLSGDSEYDDGDMDYYPAIDLKLGDIPYNLVVPQTVTNGTTTYSVVEIAFGAFGNGSRTSTDRVTVHYNSLPNGNSIYSLVLPSSITTINSMPTNIKILKCCATTPPALNKAIPSTCQIIYVPLSSLATYKSAAGWSNYADKIVGYSSNLNLISDISFSSKVYETNTATPFQLSPTVTPNSSSSNITWSSSDPSIATVNASGLVTGVSPGTCYITATSSDGGYVFSTIKFTINSTPPISNITLNETAVTLFTGDVKNIATLTPTITPSESSAVGVTWSSSNPSVASVNQNGKVTAVSKGTATITCTANDESGVTASCQIAVKELSQLVIGQTSANNKTTTAPFHTTNKHNNVVLKYTAQEIGQAGKIQAISFFQNYAYGTSTWMSLEIWMGTISNTSFFNTTTPTANYLQNMTRVYQNQIQLICNGGDSQVDIILDTPYEYDGVSDLNIFIATDFSTSNGNSSIKHYYSTTSANTVKYRGGEDAVTNSMSWTTSRNRPNIRLWIDDIVKSLNNSDISISPISAVTYTGSTRTPSVTVLDGSTTLTSGTDYTLSYSNNINAGTATVTVTGKGNYTGTKTANFTINPKSASSLTINSISAVTYNGSAQTPAVTVKDGTTTLTSGTHYTLSYSNNINAGTATATITGMGNYTGTKSANFTINAKSASNLTINSIAAVTYTGSAQTPTVTVKDGSTTLTSGTHYTVSYSNNTNAGTATVTVTGKGNYTGTKTANFTINAKNASSLTINSIAAVTYSGSEQTPAVTVKDGTTTLTSGTHYTVSYSNNTNAGTATVTITGMGNYTGTKSANFTINPKNASNLTINSISARTYTGSAQTPTVTVKDGSTTLTSGTHYTVAYSNNTNAGTATVTVTGRGNYTGTKTSNFTINPKNASNLTISDIAAVTYNGSEQTPTVTVKDGTTTLVSGTDYTVSYSNNINAGTATVTITGMGNYTGTKNANFTINAKGASNLTISEIAAVTYTGSALTPTVTVKDGSTTLTSGTHYTVAYSNNINAGTATVTITGMGNYTGTKMANFTINHKNSSNLTISSFSAVTYNGSAQTPTVTVKDGSTTLTSETDYTVSYSNNTNAGTATVAITGKGNYSGTKNANFTINKAALTITAKSYTINQKDELPEFEVTYSGFVNGETSSVLTTLPTVTCDATDSETAGDFDITPSGAVATNYSFNYVSGTLTIDEVTSVSITLNSLGKGTYCSKYPLDFTGVSGIAAYIICGFKPSAGNLSTLRVYEVPEETGLYVVGTPGSTYNIPVAPTDFYYTSMMKGITVATVIPANEDGYTNYVLASNGNGGVFFKRANNNSSPANRAYVQIPSSTAGAREFLGIELDDDSTTGLDGVITSDTEEAEGDYYNLSGQKVQTPRKGLYIKNGKKIFIH